MNRKKQIYIIGLLALLLTGVIWFGNYFRKESSERVTCELTEHLGMELIMKQSSYDLFPQQHGFYEISFNLSGGESLEYYEISTIIDTKNTVFVDLTLGFTGNFRNDINALQLQPVPLQEDTETMMVNRVILTDEKGEAEVRLFLGDETHKWSGNLRMEQPQIRKCREPEYVALASENHKIEFLIRKEDMKKLGIGEEESQKFVKELTNIREALSYLSGDYEPFDGVSRFVFTEEIGYTGLAGNPIYINTLDLEMLFQGELTRQTVGRNDILFVLSHEMSHTFDFSGDLEGECGYTFDRELFASLKAIYALEQCGYSLENGFLRIEPGLENGVYNYESLLAFLLQGAKEKQLPQGWLADMTKELRTADVNAGAYDKYFLFVNWLKDNTSLDLQEYLGVREWDTVVNYLASE